MREHAIYEYSFLSLLAKKKNRTKTLFDNSRDLPEQKEGRKIMVCERTIYEAVHYFEKQVSLFIVENVTFFNVRYEKQLNRQLLLKLELVDLLLLSPIRW